MGFVLDDVRESFTSDVARFLGEIEKGSRAIGAAATLAVPVERNWQQTLNSIVVGLHGITGSSSLIGVGSLADPARRIEDIATSADESVRMLRLHANRLKRIATLCRDGSSELRVILDHELAGRTAEAAARSRQLHQRIETTERELRELIDGAPNAGDAVEPPALKLPPLPKPPAHTAPLLPVRAPATIPPPLPSALDDGWGVPPIPEVRARGTRNLPAAVMPPEPAQSPDDELAEVFQTEAREALTNLRGYLTRLEANPGDRHAATQCARLLHLLKGAAASVGLDAISARARELHAAVEGMKISGIDAAKLAALRGDIEAFIAITVPDLAAARPAPAGAAPAITAAPDDADAEAIEIFRDEARTSIEQAHALLREIRGAAGTPRGVLTGRLERLLHRLKGSALIVGLTQIAAVASRGQALCEALDRVDPDAIGKLIAQLEEQIAPVPVAQAIPAVYAAAPPATKLALPSADEWATFVEESTELFEQIGRSLAQIESSPRPGVELAGLFRSYHTLKGAANAVGLGPIGQHLHLIESFLERLIAASQLRDLRGVVRALDEQNQILRRAISRAGSDGEVAIDHAAIAARLGEIGTDRPRPDAGTSWIAASDSVWTDRDASAPASRRAPLSSPATELSRASQLDDRDHDHDAEAPLTERRFVRVPADRLDNLLDLAGELVVCRSRMLSRVGRLHGLHEDDLARHEAVVQLIDGFAASTQFTNLDGRRRRAAATTTITAHGFGFLELDQYEEVHVLSRRLDEAASDLKEVRRDMGGEMQQLTEDAEMLSTIASGLQSEITRARMLTVDVLFSRLQLPIRDAAQRAEREIEILVSGEQLAIDKSMSDALFGPLLHMVRNAVVHGIEPPATREQLGKPRAGRIQLAASQVHGEIVLEVSDDGRGIDLARLRDVGIQRGLLPPDIAESDPLVLGMIFAKGVSTLDGADDVAGRGMGGDIVKHAIDRLNGTIQVRTVAGAGALFRILLPLSMSITQAVLVRVGGVLLAIPIAYAEMIRATEALELVDSFGKLRARIDDRIVPVYQTRRMFTEAMLRSEPTDRVIVVCAVGGERIALQVDEVVGQEEIVVKSLGTLLDGHPLFSGSTVRGDGELMLILDIPGVMESELQGERRVRTIAPAIVPVALLPAPPLALPAAVDLPPAGVPQLPPTHEPAAAPSIQLAEVAPVSEGRWRVLFVDDSLSVRKVAERMLRGLEVEVVLAVDGLDALDQLRAMAFSLVFTDLEMPRMHGYELIREMQLLPAYQAIPVVVISSRSGKKHIDQAIAMGARDYLTKPFTPEILGATLERLARKGP